ncbi:hypothetical protein BATDEDRAFT_23213 [Batrachochytrium dendrobatidis JAM81]|uniref:Peptidase A1 domain-containing protein n=1 Tax=Batrachochytrium dendrobatidis (strain JAM81 / FGSC 10211) TaxID=684364 RepID=F4NYB6_BATDJ|nr:uncharacterized protein BATDEDRAFT_23213 [Batrachochytrium dendrobatidis JAM81]EGF81685.1 hypothetical protein BATDEDRAFT_23213 [Batrachochytrium dendrobatidis JAM81]|eukprot:XP_006677220.1 hypothetical protein BATDEDRAFT_23213 [Batrachochytrium dendrobatidis JAM81]
MYQIQPIFITLLDTMLITLECILLALQAVAAVRLALESPSGIDSQSSNRLSKRSPVELGGDINKCYTIKVNVDGVNLDLQVDSAMSDIVVPLSSSSNDIGLTPQHTPSGKPVTINYKGDEYNGFSSTADVTIPGTSITDINLPVLSVEKQSADLVGISPNLDGVFGFAYSSLSKHHPPITAMDVLYSNGVIPSNEIGLQLCPYDMTSDSFINIGNTDITPKCGTDGKILPETVVATFINAILDSVVFIVTTGSNDKAVLGISFMTRLTMTFDRRHKRIGFGPGCGCEVMADGYPTISNGYQMLWPLPRLPEQPTTSGSDGTFIRRRKPITTTDQVAVPENTHHTVKSYKQTLNKLD